MKDRGLNDWQISVLIDTCNSMEISGFDSLSIDENIDILLESEKRYLAGEAHKILKLPVPDDPVEKYHKQHASCR
ncbi:MAG: hypothetical protein SGI71_04425 [Verrucomicrobiota bacterium]|nr:hypothetical protein [Verrucomicrobiota bacterium]